VTPADEAAHDPVCHETVHPTRYHLRAEYQGLIYYFCGTACHDEFVRDAATVADEERACEARRAILGEEREGDEDPDRLVEVHHSQDEEQIRTLGWILDSLGIDATVYGANVRRPWASPFGPEAGRPGDGVLRCHGKTRGERWRR
jgi:YHS domain-containing protein